MKTFKTLFSLVLALIVFQGYAQTDAPKGFTPGNIILNDGTVKTGFIKDNTRKKASISFVETAAGKAKTYDGWQLTKVEAGTTAYTCVKGDFFTVLCNGDLCFLQKASEAAGKIDYNGSEPILRAGTDGKAGDYFVYNNTTKELVMVTKESYDQVAATVFGNYEPALAKAKEVHQDVAAMQQAVEVYNKRPTK